MSDSGESETAMPPLHSTSIIDFNSPIPYYLQLYALLLESIEGGEWQQGDRLPGEHALCEDFGLSRSVVRQALGMLEKGGLIVRRRGKGAFVAEPRISESLAQKLTGFHQDMREQGRRIFSRVLSQTIIPAPVGIARLLELEAGSPVVHLERLRFVDGEPIVLVSSYLPASLCPGLEDVDFSEQSLYARLSGDYDLHIARGRRTIAAVAADERTSHLLEVALGAPLILLESVSYEECGRPLETYRALDRGDRAQFEVERVRIQGDGLARRTLGSTIQNLPSSNRVIEHGRRRDRSHSASEPGEQLP
jgi:GntR family transcriptional regulator